MVLAAMYLLIMVGKVVFGPLREPAGDHGPLPADLSMREIVVLVPLAIGCTLLGVQPDIAMDAMSGAIADTLAAFPDVVTNSTETLASAGGMP